jgi:hypothetical protein
MVMAYSILGDVVWLTIGVAKSLLCRIVRENNFIDVDGVTSGFGLTKEKRNLSMLVSVTKLI